jgi:hypothetical protein
MNTWLKGLPFKNYNNEDFANNMIILQKKTPAGNLDRGKIFVS